MRAHHGAVADEDGARRDQADDDFQSRFGRAKWLEPYTINTVKALAKKGVKIWSWVTPGFSADCLETLEEIAVDNARAFSGPAAEFRGHSLPQRQRGRHADDLAARDARAEGLV